MVTLRSLTARERKESIDIAKRIGCQNDASVTMTNVKVAMVTNSKLSVFSGNHNDDWTIWRMKMMAHLMSYGKVSQCIFGSRL